MFLRVIVSVEVNTCQWMIIIAFKDCLIVDKMIVL